MIVLRGVNLFPTQIEELILGDQRLSPHFRLILGKDKHLDTLTIQVEARSGQRRSEVSAAGAQLAESVKNSIGVTAAVEMLESGALPRSEGKVNRILDTRRG